MASTATKQYVTVHGPLKIEWIFIDANDATSLANVETALQNGFACAISEISHTDGTTNDSMTMAVTPLAVFSGASGVTQKQIDVSAMLATKHYLLIVYGS
jgi:hypothetical protein